MGNTPDMKIGIIIPFRDRGTDGYRKANLDRVADMWSDYGLMPMIVSDGRQGKSQFNRSSAYNSGYRESTADVLVFTESDMLIDIQQVYDGCKEALAKPGLVVPFTEYRYMSREDSVFVRGGAHPDDFTPESVMPNGRSIGAVNIISRETMESIGQFDEKFEGSWYDDNAVQRAFEVCAGPTRWINGPAWHLYHLPGWTGDHLSPEDKAATRRNKMRYRSYVLAKTPERIRELTAGGGYK